MSIDSVETPQAGDSPSWEMFNVLQSKHLTRNTNSCY
jgi:hypothetical protein